jgi:hypothetical protein
MGAPAYYRSSVADWLGGIVAGLFCLAVGFFAGSWHRGTQIDARARAMVAEARVARDSLRLALRVQEDATAAVAQAAAMAKAKYEADSTRNLGLTRALLAQLAASKIPTPQPPIGPKIPTVPAPTPDQLGEGLRLCLATAEQCGDARAKAEAEADAVRSENATLRERIRTDSIADLAREQAHAVALSRAASRSAFRDLKVGGGTALVSAAVCAASHVPLFRGR